MDIEGEAMVLNFIGCSIQEEADIKLAASKTAIDFTVKEDEADMHPIVVQVLQTFRQRRLCKLYRNVREKVSTVSDVF
jgi:hypothetical protein